MRAWNSIIPAKIILEGLARSRTIHADGTMSGRALGEEGYWIELLKTALQDASVTGFVHATAITRASRWMQAPEPNEFISLYMEERNRLRSATQPYLVAFSLWGKTKFLRAPLPVLDSRVTFLPAVSEGVAEKIERERERIRNTFKELFTTVFSDHARLEIILAKVYAHAPEDAFERAYKSLAMVIGCTTFVDGSESFDLFGTAVHRPSLQLLIGPQSTVHELDGRSAHDGLWYGEWVPKRNSSTQPSDERVLKVMAEVTRVCDAVKRSRWSDKCQAALLLYYDAFSEHQSSKSIFSGWRLLELIAGGQDEKSDVLIRRVASFYSDSDVAEAVGLHLRTRRNSATHGENWSLGVNAICISQLRSLIPPMLSNFLINPCEFHSVREFWSYCDATRNLDALDETERVLHAARKRRKALSERPLNATSETVQG